MGEEESLRAYAEGLLQKGNLEEAEALYRQLVERYPGNDSYLMALAWVYYDRGQLEEAISCLEELFERELTRKIFTGFAFDELVRIYKHIKSYDRLLYICERACASYPDEYPLLGDLAWAALKSGHLEKAVSVYRRMIELDPEDIDAYLGLGNALISLQDYGGAEAAYEEASRLDPSQAANFFARLADEYRKAGLLAQAEAAITRSLGYNNKEISHLLILGDILIESGKWGDGWETYEAAAALEEKRAGSVYFRLGNTLVQANLHREAARAYEKALLVEPNPLYYFHLAQTYITLGLPELAQEAMENGRKML